MSEIALRKTDQDLVPLMRKCNNGDLDPLVSYIIEKGGITSQLGRTDVYKENAPNHQMYADEISAEIQKYGGNTIPTMLGRRGKGVLYKEIVCDVAKKLKVNFNKKREVEFIEQQILLKVLETSWEKMGDKEKREFMDELGDEYKSMPIPNSFPMPLLQLAIKMGGFTSFKLALIVANSVARAILGRGLPFVVNTALTRYMAVFAGPIGWVLSGIWTLYDIASPASRVTIPCVLHIAMLRQKYMLQEQGLDLSEILPGGYAQKMPENVLHA